MSDAFVKLYKKMLEWEWYDDVNTCRVFIHCLLKANWKSGSWHGISYEPGQFITSLPNLAAETHLTVRQVRVALDHLKMTGELTDFRQSNCRVITVNNWNQYQGNDRPIDRPVTDKRQTCDRPVTADKEYKEYKEIKNNKYICSFDDFWKIYPRKNDKAKAYKCYMARLNDGYSEDQLLTACKNYAKTCEENKTEQKYIKHAATFLSVNEPFLDYLKGEDHGSGSANNTRTDEEQRNAEIDRYLESDEYKQLVGTEADMPFM